MISDSYSIKYEYISKTIEIIKSNIPIENIVGIILYGSCARGDYRYDSDVDILLIYKGDIDKLSLKRKLINELDNPDIVDLHFLNSENYNVSTYTKLIKLEGVTLYGKNIL